MEDSAPSLGMSMSLVASLGRLVGGTQGVAQIPSAILRGPSVRSKPEVKQRSCCTLTPGSAQMKAAWFKVSVVWDVLQTSRSESWHRKFQIGSPSRASHTVAVQAKGVMRSGEEVGGFAAFVL